MGRPEKPLPYEVQAEIELRIRRNESLDTIVNALRGRVSRSKVDRFRTKFLNGTAAPAAASTSRSPAIVTTSPAPVVEASDPAEVPEEIPADAPMDVLRRWLVRVEKGAVKAEEAENWPALSSLAMRAASISEAIRKATPLPKPDPNENPDMRALADQVKKRLFALVDELHTPTGSP